MSRRWRHEAEAVLDALSPEIANLLSLLHTDGAGSVAAVVVSHLRNRAESAFSNTGCNNESGPTWYVGHDGDGSLIVVVGPKFVTIPRARRARAARAIAREFRLPPERRHRGDS